MTRETIYAAYRDKVLSYLTLRAESAEDAEDLCEDVFEQVVRSLPRYDAKQASLSTWIYQITRFTLIDYLRTKHPAAPLAEDIAAAGDLEEDLIREDTLERLASALRKLPREEREIIVQRYYEGRSLTDISRLTGVSYGMVRVRHSRALRTLRSMLEGEGTP